MDKLTKEQRHRCMAAIHSRGTRPELLVRRYLFARGFRYRLNHPGLPGRPDVVLTKYRTVVFVNGCFWHGHEECGGYRLPKTNTDFWRRKIERNRERDAEERRELARMGWHCVTVWECQLRPALRERTLEGLVCTLSRIYLADRRLVPSPRYAETGEETAVAAEPETAYNARGAGRTDTPPA